MTGLVRIISDHNPLILIVIEDFKQGPRPFRMFNSWLELPDFNAIVTSSWNSGTYNGVVDIVLKNKLMKLKEDIRVWCAEKKGERHGDFKTPHF